MVVLKACPSPPTACMCGYLEQVVAVWKFRTCTFFVFLISSPDILFLERCVCVKFRARNFVFFKYLVVKSQPKRGKICSKRCGENNTNSNFVRVNVSVD